MANSTWRELANRVYRLAGLKAVDSDATFDDDNNLEKPYIQGKYAIQLAHSHMTPRVTKHLATRRIPLLVDSSTAIYNLDTGLNPSCIQYRSFFNVTAGSTSAYELINWTEQEFNRLYPDVSIITTGPPSHWILLAPERTDLSPVWRVRIFPNPDANYTLQYRAALNAYELTSASSIVLWPKEAEHALVEWAWHLLERGLGEGKEGLLIQFAKEAVDDVELIYGVPDDERRAVRTMPPIRSRSGWPYNYNRVITS